MGQIISNIIGWTHWGQTSTSANVNTVDQIIICTACFCVLIIVFYLFDTVHDIVCRIGNKTKK